MFVFYGENGKFPFYYFLKVRRHHKIVCLNAFFIVGATIQFSPEYALAGAYHYESIE